MADDEQPDRPAPRPRRQGRLPRQPGGRPNFVGVRLTDEEKVQIEARAVAAGVSVQRLMVEAALAGSAQTATDLRALMTELLGTRRLVAAISNNLNQLARLANATGEVPSQLSATADAVARAINRLDATVARLPGRRS